MSKSKVKTMLIVFFDARGVVHKEFVSQGQTANVAYTTLMFWKDRKKVIRVRKDIAATWLLHHDNAPSHTSLRIREFIAKHNAATFSQPLCSCDLAPDDFVLFPRIKTELKGHHFDEIEAIQAVVTTA